MKPLVFVSIRTTGNDPDRHDLTQIAVARCEPFDAQPTEMFSTAVRPTRGVAHAGAWLVDAMESVRDLSRGAALVAFDAAHARNFLDSLCERHELIPLALDPAAIDVRSLAWPLAPACRSIESLAAAVGLADSDAVGCLGEVRVLMAAYREMHARTAPSFAEDLNADEHAIVETLTSRMSEGRRTYGPWRVTDGRNYEGEALLEIVDALAYCGAKLVQAVREKAEAS
jgi:hypothetical protein